MRKALLLLGLCAIIVVLSLYNLENYPQTWFDEGVHLLAAGRLAVQGQYSFGPALGPTVFFPVAAAFNAGGMTLLSARIVMAIYLLLCIAVYAGLVRYIGGTKVGVVGLLLLLTSPGVGLLTLGRQMLGEVPSLFFFLAAIWLWLAVMRQTNGGARRTVMLLGSGILFGLAVLTKNQLMLWVPAWILMAVVDRFYYKQGKIMDFVLPLVTAALCVAAWYLAQRFLHQQGERLIQYNAQEWSNALQRGILTFSVQRTLSSFKFISSGETFWGLAIPGVLYGMFLSLRRTKEGFAWGLLTIVAIGWLTWLVLLSVGWERYAFIGLAITSIFIAKFFYDLTDGFSLSWKMIRDKVSNQEWDGALIRRIVIITFLIGIIVWPLEGLVQNIFLTTDDTPQQIAAYIAENLPEGGEIETYEPEICFLAQYRCHLPPSYILDAAIRYVWYGGELPSTYYDFREYGAPYLLIGTFGSWTHLYEPDKVEADYDLLHTIGAYRLYQRKA